MSLNLTGAASPGIPALDPAWAPKLRGYALLRDMQQKADAEARAAKAAAVAARDEILAALGDATAATCNNLVVTVKVGTAAPASVTLATGQRILWDKVASLLVGNVVVPAGDVKTLFDGRAGSVSLSIAEG